MYVDEMALARLHTSAMECAKDVNPTLKQQIELLHVPVSLASGGTKEEECPVREIMHDRGQRLCGHSGTFPESTTWESFSFQFCSVGTLRISGGSWRTFGSDITWQHTHPPTHPHTDCERKLARLCSGICG